MPRHVLTQEDRIKGGKTGKRRPLHEIWGEKITELKGAGKNKKAFLDELLVILKNEARTGNLKAVEILLDRVYGKAAQHILMETTDVPVENDKPKNSIADQIKALREPEKIIEVKPEPVKPKRKTAPKKKAAKKKAAKKKTARKK